MIEALRFVMTRLGFAYVVLVDFDGAHNIRRIKWRNGAALAERYGFGIATARLLDDGKTSDVPYVARWEPYEPFAAKVWPSFTGHRAS